MSMSIIVMTGGTSGIGAVAVKQMLLTTDTRLLLGTRHKKVLGAETLDLDLASLDSVRSFASNIIKQVGTEDIDCLVLNAGLSLPNDTSITSDGFEMAFGVNHLAHYLLLRLLLPKLAHGATIVLTTSGAHNPKGKARMAPPIHADARLLAYPSQNTKRDKDPKTAGERAYTSSKLCNILTARAISMLPEAQSLCLNIVAYSPGATPGTGLTRSNGLVNRAVWMILGSRIFKPLTPNMNSIKDAGNALASISLGNIRPTSGRIYAALKRGQITWPDPSELALRDDLMQAMWQDSAALVGMPK